MEHLKFRGILPIPARHSQIAKDELWKECQVESYEHDESCQFSPSLWVHASGDFWPPKMESRHIRDDHSPNHDVVEMCNHEVGVSDMNIETECRQEKTGEPANREQ